MLGEVTPLNDWFEFMGYDTPYTLVNFGSAIFILPIVTVLLIFLQLISYFKLPKIIKRISYRILDSAVFNFYIKFVNEMLLNFTICSMLSVHVFQF